MEMMQVAQGYFDAWNRRDPAGIAGAFADGGTYSDPATGGELTGDAIAGYAGALFAAFPDLSLEVVSAGPIGEDRAAAQWVMRGTQDGPFAGLPPSGRAVVLPGADFITFDGDRIRSVAGYFDQKALSEQLGIRALVLAPDMGPVSFGTCVYVRPAGPSVPGAISLTALTARSDAEVAEIQEVSQRISQEMAAMPGYLSSLFATAGHRMFTVTAWEDPESPRRLLREGTHRDAASRFFASELAVGGQTSVWIPARLNRMWVRCGACGRMADSSALERRCPGCGESLPEPPPFW